MKFWSKFINVDNQYLVSSKRGFYLSFSLNSRLYGRSAKGTAPHDHHHVIRRTTNREPKDENKTALIYKSERRAKLGASGYRIHGSTGDQWSDLLGSPQAKRSFKLPNPMYHIA